MCGRYSARQRPPGFEGEWEACFSVAPSQHMPVRTGDGYLSAGWGFLPHWAKDDARFFFAGLYTPAAGERDPTYAILTTDASPELAPIHHRMPLALEPEEAGIWVDDGASRGNLQNLIRPAASGRFEAYPVSTYVNRPANEGSECVEPDPSVGPRH